MEQADSPILNIEEQIKHLRSKNVNFYICSEKDALQYLSKNNNYFKLRAYRTGFEKYLEGKNKGKYIDLDFGKLQDLAIIDMELRYLLLHMALDVEHFAKVRLLKLISDKGEDGYSIVKDYINSLDDTSKNILIGGLKRQEDSCYCGGIATKFSGNYPVWAFLEIISFGTLVHFYRFCWKRFDSDSLKSEHFLLLGVKSLRNAAAHNSCVINDLSPGKPPFKTHDLVTRALAKVGLTPDSRIKKMSNTKIQHIVTLLFAHTYFVASDGVQQHVSRSLQLVTTRMFRNIDYYEKNETISTSFLFIKTVIDKWFPNTDNKST